MPDEQILALFEGARPIDTPTPGVRAWLAQDRADGQRPVLIKRVDGRAGSKGRATEALALLHPAVVRTRRWLAEDGALYVVRDVVRGKNLRHLLAGEDTPSSAASLRRLLLPAIEALEYAHAQGFAHGGVSPENVLVGDEGGVYVSDFATADPKAPQHFVHYNGTASFGGDVRALSRVLLEFLPTTGAFASAAVRERIGGIIGRCDTPADLKEAVNALERLAAAPIPRAPQQAPPPPQPRPAALEEETGASHGTPRLTCTLSEKSARAARGGGAATLLVKNRRRGARHPDDRDAAPVAERAAHRSAAFHRARRPTGRALRHLRRPAHAGRVSQRGILIGERGGQDRGRSARRLAQTHGGDARNGRAQSDVTECGKPGPRRQTAVPGERAARPGRAGVSAGAARRCAGPDRPQLTRQ